MPAENEIELCAQYFDEIADDTAACRKLVETITARMESGDLSTEHGNDFLNIRCRLLVAYLTNLTSLLQIKCSGLKLESNPVVDRLIDIRVYIEKSQKIYKKMSYQIEKILSLGKNIENKQNNPLTFKPSPHNLLEDEDTDDDDDGDHDSSNGKLQSASSSSGIKKKRQSNVYIPPKVAAMMYDDDETAELNKQKALEKAKKRALSSNIIQDLRREYDEGPEEISTGSVRKKKIEKKLNEIKNFEEENFTRVTLSKKEKQSLKRSMASGQNIADEITNFGDTSFLTSDEKGPNVFKNKSKSKLKSNSIKSKKRKRKFRR